MTAVALLPRMRYQPYGPVIEFEAYGIPVPQGNIRHLGKGRPAIHQNAATLLPWRRLVAAGAHNAMVQRRRVTQRYTFPLDGPIGLAVHVTVPKPKAAPKTRRTYPTTRPDLTHYVRAVEDAISSDEATLALGRVLGDDSQIVWEIATKAYPGEELHALDRPGVIVAVYQIGEADA